MLKTRDENFEVLYAEERPAIFTRDDLVLLERRVEQSALKRTRLCAHASPADALHEMFIVQCPATYIRPHKHVDKAESMLVLAGQADVIFFDEEGEIDRVVRVGDYASALPFFYRLDDGVFHSLIVRTATFLFKEATQGPFDKSKTTFAPWSPAEGDPSASAYVQRLHERVAARVRVQPCLTP